MILPRNPVGQLRPAAFARHGTILADNYNSLQYAGDMLRSLNDIGHDSVSRHVLRQSRPAAAEHHRDQRKETTALERHIASLSDPVTEAEIQTVREDLFRIMELNMAAIRTKLRGGAARRLRDVVADRRGRTVRPERRGHLIWFPQTVLRPIDTLKRGIKEIANHNYRQRLVDFTGNREFESVAESFNDTGRQTRRVPPQFARRPDDGEKRIEAIVNTLHEPIIGLDPERPSFS